MSVTAQSPQASTTRVSAHLTGNSRGWTVGFLLFSALAALPWLVDHYTISTVSRMLVTGLLAISVALLTGTTGMPTLGQTAYFGVGAYVAALLGRSGFAVGLVQLVAAAALATVVAVLAGSVVVRTRGVTFLMLTFALGELAHTAAQTWHTATGTEGVTDIPPVVPFPGVPPLTNDGLVFYYIFAVFSFFFIGMGVLIRSPFGLALRGVRDNEDRMRATGYSPYRYLLSCYGVAGGLAGAAGALWVSLHRYFSPGEMTFSVAAMALLAGVIGGMNSMWGPCVGAALVILVHDTIGGGQYLSVAGQATSGPLLLGALFIIVVYLLPQGVTGLRPSAYRLRMLRRFRGGAS